MNIEDTLGNCRVLTKLGQGGMGAVFRARDEVLHRDVANGGKIKAVVKERGTSLRRKKGSAGKKRGKR